jgi:hypothetical protein
MLCSDQLARHYVDAVEEVQQAARALMEGTIHRMRPEVRLQIVAAWAPRVLRLAASPAAAAAAADLSSPQGVSVLVLAVLASRFGTPLESVHAATHPNEFAHAAEKQAAVLCAALSTHPSPHPRVQGVATLLVKQLVGLLDHPTELHRSAAAELLGKGYAVWRIHVPDPAELIRTLFRLSAAFMSAAAQERREGAAAAATPAADGAARNAEENAPSLNRYLRTLTLP